MQHDGIEVPVCPRRDAACYGKGELIGGPGDETVKGVALLKPLEPTLTGGNRSSGLDFNLENLRNSWRGVPRESRAAVDVQARLQIKAATQRVVLRPELANTAPRIVANPVARDARCGHDTHLVSGLAQRRLTQPRPECRVTQFTLENQARLSPHGQCRCVCHGARSPPARHSSQSYRANGRQAEVPNPSTNSIFYKHRFSVSGCISSADVPVLAGIRSKTPVEGPTLVAASKGSTVILRVVERYFR